MSNIYKYDFSIYAMGCQQIGDILIFSRLKRSQAQKFLKKFNSIKTICMKTGNIKGKYRIPQIKVLASRVKKEKTITIHEEYGIFYRLDVSKIMFAKGNINERHRIADIAKKSEIVVDMFAGIGYFSLPLAKFSKAKRIYAVEMNPVSFHYLLENIKLNKLNNITAIKGDCSQAIKKFKIKADRIIMGLLPSPYRYVESAFKISKKGTIIHYSCLIPKKDSENEIKKLIEKINSISRKYGFKAVLKKAVKVKNYSPAFFHYVLDILLK